MVIRTYFDKTNTIVKGSLVNTGKNPVTELYYGTNNNDITEYSRFLFHFNMEDILKHFNTNDFGNVKHILKMTNTGVFHNDLLNTTTGDGKKRTSSFKLQVFKLAEHWDEGVGYDYGEGGPYTTTYFGASNSKFAKTASPWVTNPFEVLPEVYEQEFDAGNENMEIDITDLVNTYISNPAQNFGIGIAFDSALEQLTTEELQYVAFFTRHTQTFYQPFIESKHITPIHDDRNFFYLDKENKLYLYSNTNGTPTDLESDVNGVTVVIKDYDGTVIEGPITAVREREGVYSAQFTVPYNDNVGETYYDTWTRTNGMDTIQITEMQFELIPNSEYQSVGSYDIVPDNYRVDIRGIKHNERIKSGDIRKVYVNAVVPYSVNVKAAVDKIEYRIFVKEGNLEHTVIDFEDVDKTFNNNYFLLDTQSLLPNTYYVDIRMYSNMEVRSTPEVIKFEIFK